MALHITLFFSIFIFLIVFFAIKENNLVINLILLFSIYLIVQTLFDFYESLKNKSINPSRIVSHFGFGLLIFFISINNIYSEESNFNFKVGEKKNIKNYIIEFEKLETSKVDNYKTIIGHFLILNKKNLVRKI